MSVLAVLQDVRERLADPKRWLQGAPTGIRGRGRKVNCWCLSEAINIALTESPQSGLTWTELRSEVERELLTTLDATVPSHKYVAVYQYNDDLDVEHPHVLALLDITLSRLQEAA